MRKESKIEIRVTDTQKQLLQDLAKQRNTSVSQLIRKLAIKEITK